MGHPANGPFPIRLQTPRFSDAKATCRSYIYDFRGIFDDGGGSRKSAAGWKPAPTEHGPGPTAPAAATARAAGANAIKRRSAAAALGRAARSAALSPASELRLGPQLRAELEASGDRLRPAMADGRRERRAHLGQAEMD